MFKTSSKKIIASLLLIVTIFNCTLITLTSEVNASSTQFYNIAKNVHADFRKRGFTYELNVLKQITNAPYRTNNIYTNRKTRAITDCSHFVSVALYKYFPPQKRLYMRQNTRLKNHQLTSKDFYNIGYYKIFLKRKYNSDFSKATIKKLANYFTSIHVSEKNLRKGDILVYSNHVEIFSYMKNGKMYVLNCGTNPAIKAAGDVSKSNHSIGQIKYILRVN